MSSLSPGSDCDTVERTPEQEAHHIIRRIRQHVLLLDRQWTGVNHVSNDWQNQIDETLEVKFKLKSLRYCRLSRFWLILPPYNVFQLSIIIVLSINLFTFSAWFLIALLLMQGISIGDLMSMIMSSPEDGDIPRCDGRHAATTTGG